MAQEKFNVTNLVNNDGCFDLQFRKDTRHERTNSPTYYRWKVQFIITTPKENAKILGKVKKIFGCGAISTAKNQARFSVQKVDDVVETIIPYFNKNVLAAKKKRDFDLWKKAVEIVHRNKGIPLTTWKKNDVLHLITIQKSTAKYKSKPKTPKWIGMAHTLTKAA